MLKFSRKSLFTLSLHILDLPNHFGFFSLIVNLKDVKTGIETDIRKIHVTPKPDSNQTVVIDEIDNRLKSSVSPSMNEYRFISIDNFVNINYIDLK